MTWLERFLARAYASRSADLALFRILWATWLLLDYLPRARWATSAPRLFFSPPLGLPALLSEPLGAGTLLALEVAAATAALFLLLGCATRVASLATAALVLALDSAAFAFEGPSHTLLAYAVPGLLAFSSWGRMFSVDARRGRSGGAAERDAFLLALLAFLIGAAFFWAGYVKGASGWLDPDRHAIWGHLARTWFITERGTAITSWVVNVDLPWAWALLDWATLALELGLLPAFFFPRVFRLLLACACIFHLGVYLLFAIPFSWNVAAYGAFVPWSSLSWPQAARVLGARFARLVAAYPAQVWLLPCLLGGFALTLLADPSPEPSVFRRAADSVVLFGGAAIGISFLLHSVSAGLRRVPSVRG